RILSDSGAHEVVRAFQAEIHDLGQSAFFGKGMTGFLGKLPGVLGALGLALHRLQDPENGRERPVEGDVMQSARKILDDFVIPHA
ncbi:hypothetical protein, partial [Corynebacterium diphtheriae]|uniref:hypothetical protein n=1 Tax=Corynebacterium diphtheriae TaxID=1717 RepID=UPI000D4CE375